MIRLIVILSCLIGFLFLNPGLLKDSDINKIKSDIFEEIIPIFQDTKPLIIEPTPVQTIDKPKLIPKVTPDTEPWGVAKQIGEYTWTMKIANDTRMATPSEILVALNEYRQRQGSQLLVWDNTLADYAQSRADYFFLVNKTDAHKGFLDFIENQDGYNKLGYNWLGENSSFGYKVFGVHLIEWVFAGDKPHDDNQLAQRWDHAGIGVKGTAVDIIFATSKR
ncbi:MAG: CAP domain-containing protein [Candidatus Shapirobacteria bacterium]|nr:CAP domain-containing protein [Candidatus Shapirobacteria bacterium]